MANNYDDKSIVSMKFLEHLRAKSGMYGFRLATVDGAKIQLKEVIDNATDEALDKNKIYPIDITFFVSKDKTTYQCLVRDHGRGIPVGKIVDCFTKEFTSGKYRNDYGAATVGTNGVGSKASAALSKIFIAFTKRMDGFGYVRIEKGVVTDHKIQNRAIDKKEDSVGTVVILQPDTDLVVCADQMFAKNVTGEQVTGFDQMLSQLQFYSLFKRNVVLSVRTVEGLLKPADLNKDPVDLWKYLTNLDNFKTELVFKSDLSVTPRIFVQRQFGLKEPIWSIGELHKDGGDTLDDPLGYDIDIFLDERSAKGNNGYIGAINATPIVHPESSHIAQLQLVIKDQIANAIDDDEKQMYFINKYRLPISGCISANWQGAEFLGQDKTRFENRQFESVYRMALRRDLKKITESQGDGIWDRLWELIKDNFEQEYAKYSRTAYRTGGDLKNLCYDLNRPESFSNCKLKNNGDTIKTELFITEGDSAAGRVKSERDANTQAVLKLSGKPKNAIRDDGPKLKENAIYADLCRILGVNRSDTDLKNMRFDKILLMADADADGYHIVALMLGMFYKINPLILSEGHVYVTNPPLYSILHGSSATYLRDVEALEEARRSSYRTLFDIDVVVYSPDDVKHEKAGTKFHINKDVNQFRDICLIVETIGDVVSRQADLLNIDPLVLEQLVHCVDYLDEKKVDVKEIKKILTASDVRWDQINNVVVLIYESNEHSIEYRIPLAKLQKTIRENILPVYERFHWKDMDLFITTKYSDVFVEDPCTFVMLYTIFKKISDPDHGVLKVRRFKGLGEMSKEAITYTCIDPATRSFTPIHSIGDVDRIYKMLGVDTEERKKLVNSGLVKEV